MASVDLLVTGYVRPAEDGDAVQPTICLVRAGDRRIVVDPGMLADPGDLIRALEGFGLAPGEVTDVFLTHHHLDHTRNAGLFPAARVIDGSSIYQGDRWSEHSGDGYEIAPGVRVMHTPGHARDGASLVVETEAETQVLTHAWWFPDMTPEEDPMAEDPDVLPATREMILRIADVVVPGHGGPFEVAR